MLRIGGDSAIRREGTDRLAKLVAGYTPLAAAWPPAEYSSVVEQASGLAGSGWGSESRERAGRPQPMLLAGAAGNTMDG